MNQIRGIRTIGTTVLSAALLFGGVACSNDNKSESTATTTTTKASTSNKSFDVVTEDGQVSLSLDGKLPPGWPKDFPVPDGAEAAGSGSLGGSDTTVMIGLFTASGEPSAAYDFYTRDAGLDVEGQTSLGAGDRYVGTLKFGGTWSGRVTVVPRDGKTLAIVRLSISDDTGDTNTSDTTVRSGSQS